MPAGRCASTASASAALGTRWEQPKAEVPAAAAKRAGPGKPIRLDLLVTSGSLAQPGAVNEQLLFGEACATLKKGFPFPAFPCLGTELVLGQP